MRRLRRWSVDERLADIVERKATAKWKRAAVVLKHRQGLSIHKAALEVGVSWRAAAKWVGGFENVDQLMKETRGRKPRRPVWRPRELTLLARLRAERSHRDRQTNLRRIAMVGVLAARGYSNKQIAAQFRPRWRTQRVARWRARFIEDGLNCIPEKWRLP